MFSPVQPHGSGSEASRTKSGRLVMAQINWGPGCLAPVDGGTSIARRTVDCTNETLTENFGPLRPIHAGDGRIPAPRKNPMRSYGLLVLAVESPFWGLLVQEFVHQQYLKAWFLSKLGMSEAYQTWSGLVDMKNIEGRKSMYVESTGINMDSG